MLKVFTNLLILILLNNYYAESQTTHMSCPDIRNGVFYSYPMNTIDRWKSERNGDIQKEINIETGDTLIFKVSWDRDCEYKLKYQSGGKKLKKEELNMLKQYNFVYTVSEATPNYYIATTFLNEPNDYPISVDTMWNKERPVSHDRVVFTNLSPTDIRKIKLKDTSHFALLYVYRPSKFVCGGIGFPMYANNMLMCGFPAKGGGAFVFKVVKEGPMRLQGQHKQKKDFLDLNIRFGQKYYVRVDTKWSMARCIPYLLEKDKLKGEEGFIEAQY